MPRVPVVRDGGHRAMAGHFEVDPFRHLLPHQAVGKNASDFID
jgi:hypothetical protein